MPRHFHLQSGRDDAHWIVLMFGENSTQVGSSGAMGEDFTQHIPIIRRDRQVAIR